MVIVKTKGGLGNQLFQYAFARNLEISCGAKVKLDHLSWTEQYKEREYKLSNYNISEDLATSEEVEKFKQYKKRGGKLAILHNLFIANESIYIKERQFDFDPTILAFREKAYFDGVWHTEKYFKGIENTIRKEITLKNPPSEYFTEIAEKMSRVNSVSLHVRRGDYLTMKKAIDTIGVCPIDYYYTAEEILTGRTEKPTFFIFSDDIEWVKHNLKLKSPMIFVSNDRTLDYEELILMSKCKHNIIANSSFSWWGAWLNSNPQKIVIAPEKWFKDGAIHTKDIVPESWLKI